MPWIKKKKKATYELNKSINKNNNLNEEKDKSCNFGWFDPNKTKPKLSIKINLEHTHDTLLSHIVVSSLTFSDISSLFQLHLVSLFSF